MIFYENLAEVNKIFFEEYKKSFDHSLNSGWYILGKNVKSFENDFAVYLGTQYCVGVASGLDALLLSIKAFEFEKGSEVITPSNTYIATILSILNAGMKPVLVEPDIRTYNIDPLKIEERITSKTKALMIVHLYGRPCSMDPIQEICKKHNLKLIEDCAQSHGSMYKGKMTGTFGEFGAWSFYPTKNLGALGDAGAITTNNNSHSETIKMYRNYGSKVKYYNEVIGYNSRLDEIQAGFLSIKLKSLDKINEHKRKLADIYQENLKEDFIKPVVDEDYYHVYHIYNIRHPQRDKLKEYLLRHGIKTDIHYPVPPHKQNAMQGILRGEFPVSEIIHKTTLSLPISFAHTEDDVFHVIDVINQY